MPDALPECTSHVIIVPSAILLFYYVYVISWQLHSCACSYYFIFLYAISALMLLVGWHCRNFCFKAPWDEDVSGWTRSTLCATRLHTSKEGNEGLLACPMRLMRIKMTGNWVSMGQPANPGLSGKWPLKIKKVCACVMCLCVLYIFHFVHNSSLSVALGGFLVVSGERVLNWYNFTTRHCLLYSLLMKENFCFGKNVFVYECDS